MTVLLALLVFSSSAIASSSPPVIESESVSGVSEHDATLEAQINTGGAATHYQLHLEYGCGISGEACAQFCVVPGPCPGPVNGPVDIPLPSGDLPGSSQVEHVSLDLHEIGVTLEPGTKYRYSIEATNTAGTAEGSPQFFTTPSSQPAANTPPSIESESVSHVTSTDATLEATINPDGQETSYEVTVGTVGCVEEGGPANDCESTREGQIVGTLPGDYSNHTVTFDVATAWRKLSPNVTYVFWVRASNPAGKVGSNFKVFKTPTTPLPVIESESLSHLTSTDATLEAQINTEGLETAYEFQLLRHLCPPGTEPLGCKAMIQKVPLPSGRLLGSFVSQAVSLDLNSVGVTLYPGTEYDYRVLVTSAAGKAEGGSQTFVTPEDGVQPLNTITSPGSQLGVGTQSAIGITTAHTVIATTTGQVTPPPKNTLKPKMLTNAHQLAQALKQCAKKPKKQRASCRKQAHRRYGTTGKKGK